MADAAAAAKDAFTIADYSTWVPSALDAGLRIQTDDESRQSSTGVEDSR